MVLVVKAVVGLGLLVAIALALWAPAPRILVARLDLRRLLAGALTLYAVGVFAALEHRGGLALAASALGVGASALAGWLSRGTGGSDEPPRGSDDGRAPDGGRAPDPEPGLDWSRFDRERRRWERPPTVRR